MSRLSRRACLATLLAGACGLAQAADSATAPPPEPGDETALPRPMPRWLLQAANGRTLTTDDLQGRFQLVAFGFVSCPDVCPTTMLEMKQVLAALGPRAKQLQPLFISVDPERDTLPVLGAYAAAFDDRIIALTGPPALLARAAEGFKVRYEKVREPGAPANIYTMDHTAGMFLVGPDGQLLTRFAYGTPAAELSARITRWIDAAQR